LRHFSVLFSHKIDGRAVITVMPSAYRNAPWIEVEAKLKEEAIEKLRV
jgi:UV DNA damage repair endonuclease